MTKIMFVCHGNICRSPMAEFIFKRLVLEKGMTGSFYVSSSATSTEEIWGDVGNPVYPPAKAELKKHGIECDGKRAVHLTRADLEKYDMFIPDELLRHQYAADRLRTDEVIERIHDILNEY